MEPIQPIRLDDECGADAVPEKSDPTAWEQIEHGRYQPRRIRGSYRGRELG